MSIQNNKHLLHLLPHGINSNVFKPINKEDNKYKEIYKRYFGNTVYDYVLFFNSRNMNRKRTSNIILAWRIFCDSLTKEEASKCMFMMHTEPALDAGTDLPAVIEALCPMYNTKIIADPLMPDIMNVLYNIADTTINISSSEGFGLSCAESMMAGTPVIVNVTGGLQDQIDQRDDTEKPVEFTREFSSNNIGKYNRFGKWAFPIFPAALTLQGSIPTPFILDDLCKIEDIADAIMYWYLTDNSTREENGQEGRRWAMNEGNINSQHMASEFIKAMDFTLANFVPRKPFDIHTDAEFIGYKMPNDKMGIEFPQINKDKLLNKIKATKENGYCQL